LVHLEDAAGCDRRRAPHPDGLPRQASLAEEVAGPHHPHDRLSSGRREHRELHTTLPDVEDILAGIALGEYHLASAILHDLSRGAPGVEKRLKVERSLLLRFHGQTPLKPPDRGRGLRRLGWTVDRRQPVIRRAFDCAPGRRLTIHRCVHKWTANFVAVGHTSCRMNTRRSGVSPKWLTITCR